MPPEISVERELGGGAYSNRDCVMKASFFFSLCIISFSFLLPQTTKRASRRPFTSGRHSISHTGCQGQINVSAGSVAAWVIPEPVNLARLFACKETPLHELDPSQPPTQARRHREICVAIVPIHGRRAVTPAAGKVRLHPWAVTPIKWRALPVVSSVRLARLGYYSTSKAGTSSFGFCRYWLLAVW